MISIKEFLKSGKANPLEELKKLHSEEKIDIRSEDCYVAKWAVKKNDRAMFEWLLEQGLDDEYDDHELLCLALSHGHIEIANLILDHEDGYAEVESDCSVLDSAIETGNAELVKRLLDMGAMIMWVEEEDLEKALKNEHYEVLQVLLDNDVICGDYLEMRIRGAICNSRVMPQEIKVLGADSLTCPYF